MLELEGEIKCWTKFLIKITRFASN
jgi:hypothetical protein